MKLLIRLITALILAAFLAGCAAPSEPAPILPSATASPPNLPKPTPDSTLAPAVSYGSGDPTATVAATPAATEEKHTKPPETVSETPTITLSDNGSTLKLKQGQRFLLQLGEAYDWQLIVADQSVVSRVKNVMVIRGAQGLFDALNPGQSEVSAMGDPVCRSQKPACAQPSVLFRLTVIVE